MPIKDVRRVVQSASGVWLPLWSMHSKWCHQQIMTSLAHCIHIAKKVRERKCGPKQLEREGSKMRIFELASPPACIIILAPWLTFLHIGFALCISHFTFFTLLPCDLCLPMHIYFDIHFDFDTYCSSLDRLGKLIPPFEFCTLPSLHPFGKL